MVESIGKIVRVERFEIVQEEGFILGLYFFFEYVKF